MSTFQFITASYFRPFRSIRDHLFTSLFIILVPAVAYTLFDQGMLTDSLQSVGPDASDKFGTAILMAAGKTAVFQALWMPIVIIAAVHVTRPRSEDGQSETLTGQILRNYIRILLPFTALLLAVTFGLMLCVLPGVIAALLAALFLNPAAFTERTGPLLRANPRNNLGRLLLTHWPPLVGWVVLSQVVSFLVIFTSHSDGPWTLVSNLCFAALTWWWWLAFATSQRLCAGAEE